MSSSITASTSCKSDPVAVGQPSPCLSCGACCASFRVSFYWAEADDAPAGWVPVQLTRAVTPHLRAMLGTDGKVPHCVALEGVVGQAVSCSIYARRPSTCREFDWCLPDGSLDPRCAEARARRGLPPFALEHP